MATKKMELIVSLKDNFSKRFRLVGSALDGVKKRAMALKGAILNLKTAMISLSAIYTAKKLMDVSNEQAKAVIGMETALRSMGNYTPEFSRKLQQIASDIQSVTNHGDENILVGQKFLLTYKDIGLDVMPRVSMAMADLATLMGGDMRSAANMLGKASMGMTGELRRVGITVDANVYKTEGFLGVLKAIEAQSKGQAIAQRKATGSLIAMGNSFADVTEKAGDFIKMGLEPLFKVLLSKFDDLNNRIVKLKEEGKLAEWANELSTKAINSLEFMVMGTLSVYEEFAPIMTKFKKLFTGIWDWFKKLDPWVQTSGLILAVMGGRNVRLTLLVLAAAGKGIGAIKDEIRVLTYEFDKGRPKIENYLLELEALEIKKRKLSKASIFGESDEEFKERIKKLKEVNERIETLGELISQITPLSVIDEESETDTISRMRAGLVGLFKELRKEQKEWMVSLSKPPEPEPKKPAVEAVAKPRPIPSLAAQIQKELLILEVLYKKGEEELIAYLEKRNALVLLALELEIKALEEAAKVETDSTKRFKIQDAIFVKKQQYALKEIELIAAIAQAHEDAGARRLEVEEMLRDLKTRTNEDLDSAQAAELAKMDARHAEELSIFKKEFDDKLAVELGYIDKADAIRDISRQQQLEKDKLLAEQQKALWDKKLDFASEAAGHLKSILTDLYEIGDKKSKKMFKLMKAVAIAEAFINTSKAVTGALGVPPYGLSAIAMAALIALKGGVEIAKIKSQEMAEGGEIQGYSPHSKADNISIRGTAGEFMQPVTAVKHYGKKAMEGIRHLAFPKELFQGFSLPTLAYARPSNQLALGGSVAGSQRSDFSVSVPVNISSERVANIAGTLQNEVEETVIRVMERELR